MCRRGQNSAPRRQGKCSDNSTKATTRTGTKSPRHSDISRNVRLSLPRESINNQATGHNYFAVHGGDLIIDYRPAGSAATPRA